MILVIASFGDHGIIFPTNSTIWCVGMWRSFLKTYFFHIIGGILIAAALVSNQQLRADVDSKYAYIGKQVREIRSNIINILESQVAEKKDEVKRLSTKDDYMKKINALSKRIEIMEEKIKTLDSHRK